MPFKVPSNTNYSVVKLGQQQGGIWCLREVFVMVWGAARRFLAKVCLLSPRGFGSEAGAGEPNELCESVCMGPVRVEKKEFG